MDYNNFNTGDLTTDINNISKMMSNLEQLKKIKENERRAMNRMHEQKKKMEDTMMKINQMNQNCSKFDLCRGHDYIHHGCGLKTFHIQLIVHREPEYEHVGSSKSMMSLYASNMVLHNLQQNVTLFGRIIGICPFEAQMPTVLQTEYTYVQEKLESMLPIDVTIGADLHTSLIHFDTGYDYIWVNTAGDAFISGVSLTN